MIIPVRCFTCGRVLGSSFETFKKRVEMGEKPKSVLDSLGITRYCCRRMLLSNADLIEDILPFG